MTEREYLKVNTSIQTGSNANRLVRGEKGDIEAVIELQLPDNLFESGHGKDVVRAEMQTSKMRLSLQNTPIAKLPYDEYRSEVYGFPLSKCQLGIWPFVIRNAVKEKPGQYAFYPVKSETQATPNIFTYRKRILDLGVSRYWANVNGTTTQATESTAHSSCGYAYADCKDVTKEKYSAWSRVNDFFVPEVEPFLYGGAKSTNLPFNLSVVSGHLNGGIDVMSVSELEKCLAQALQRAFVLSLGGDPPYADIIFVRYIKPEPGLSIEVFKQRYQLLRNEPDAQGYYLWNIGIRQYRPSAPSVWADNVCFNVHITDNSLNISYDTSCFSPHLTRMNGYPLLASTWFGINDVLTGSRDAPYPYRIPNKIPRFDVEQDITGSYGFRINTTNVLFQFFPFSIIGNQAMYETFSFLPWIKIDMSLMPNYFSGDDAKNFYMPNIDTFDGNCFYILDTTSATMETKGPEAVNMYVAYTYDKTVTTTDYTNAADQHKTKGAERTVTTLEYDSRLFNVAWTFSHPYTGQPGGPIDPTVWGPDESIVYNTTIDETTNYVADDPQPAGYPQDTHSDGTAAAPVTTTTHNSTETKPVLPAPETYDKVVPGTEVTTTTYDRAGAEYHERMFQTTNDPNSFINGVWNSRLEQWKPPDSGEDITFVDTIRDEEVEPGVWWQVVQRKYRTGAYMDTLVGVIETVKTNYNFTRHNIVYSTASLDAYSLQGNVTVSNTWSNIPFVVMSPISSIVLTMDGITLKHEIQPINAETKGGSSLTQAVPVIENYLALATSLADLHDELVITRAEFDDTATYVVDPKTGTDRTITLRAKYIEKDGTMHQIYIPDNGVFYVQLTFGLDIYTSH